MLEIGNIAVVSTFLVAIPETLGLLASGLALAITAAILRRTVAGMETRSADKDLN